MGLLVLATVIVIAIKFGELKDLYAIFSRAQPLWLIAGGILQLGTYVCAASVWYLVLAKAGSRQSLISVVPLGLARLFVDQAMPTGGVSGTVLVMQGLKRRGVKIGTAMAALLVSLVSFYGAYLLAVLIGLLVLALLGKINPIIIAAAGVFAVVAIGIPSLVLVLKEEIDRPIFKRLTRLPGVKILREAIAKSPRDLLHAPKLVGAAVLLQFAVFLLDAATLYAMLLALGVTDADPGGVFASFIIASVAATIGLVPLGLGTFEGVCLLMLKLIGVPLEIGLTAILLFRGLTFWLPMLPGMMLAQRELKEEKGSQPAE